MKLLRSNKIPMKNFEYKKARQFLQQKEIKRQKILNERFLRANSDFEKIKDLIIQKYNPKRIWQWGSLLNRDKFSEISDIDIAVEGITSAKIFFKMYGDVMNLSEFSIDLIQIEKIESEFADTIKSGGKIVYECR